MLAVQVCEDAVLVLEPAEMRALRGRLRLLRRWCGAERPCKAVCQKCSSQMPHWLVDGMRTCRDVTNDRHACSDEPSSS